MEFSQRSTHRNVHNRHHHPESGLRSGGRKVSGSLAEAKKVYKPAMDSSLFNGERAVVLLFIGKVLLSSSISLFAEGFALFLLALAALTVEISFQNSNRLTSLSNRPGVSSGILVGAVTLPSVFMSRLIQLLRAVSLHEIGISDFEYLRAQYWVVYYCCTSLILSLILIYGKPCRNARDMFIFTCAALSTSASFLSFASQSHSGWYGTLKLIWALLHGLVAIKFVHHIFRTFPSCASVGEVFLVTSGLVLYFGDMLTLTLIQRCFTSPQLFFEQFSNRSEISILNQGLILGILLCPAAYTLAIQSWEYACKFTSYGEKINGEIIRSLIFYTLITFVLILGVPSWMKFVHDFQSHPFLWVVEFIFSDPLRRVILCVYWVGIIYVSVFRFYNLSKNSKTERILLRKYYHLMAVIMFIPALIFQLKFLYLALGVALAAFLVLEIVRVWRIWPMGHLLHRFMNAFTDHRDSDLLIISHFSLLVGCALPIWMSYGYTDRPLASFSGILSLGIGDTMASIVGHKYGVLRWSKAGKKTIEGTAAGITSVMLACSVILPLLSSTGYICTQGWFSLVTAVTLSGLLEAYTTQLDNAFIPLIFYSLLCL